MISIKPDTTPPLPIATSAATQIGDTDRFARTLSGATRSADELREAAAQLVSAAFLRPLLAEARQDPFRSDLFHGGRGEEIFGEQFDGLLADRITEAADFPVTDAIVRRFSSPDPTPSSQRVNVLG